MQQTLMDNEAQGIPGALATPRTVHLSLQGKGGVGKSLIASLLAQFFIKREASAPSALTLTPVNQTFFSQYAALGAQHLPLMDKNQLDRRRFDSLVDTILATDESFIVDNGASTFAPLWHYMLEGAVTSVLREGNQLVYPHSDHRQPGA